MRPVRSSVRGVEGAAAVEFSLIAALLITLVLGILQFGLNYSRLQGLHAAAREGARLASLGGPLVDADVVQRVIDEVPPFIKDKGTTTTDGDIAIRVLPAGTWCAAQGDTVTVQITLTAQGDDRYRISLPGFSRLFEMDTQATYLCESGRGP